MLSLSFFHDIGLPPLWLMAIIALVSLACDVVILYGIVFVLTKWNLFERWMKIVVVLIGLVMPVAATIFGYLATAPFGLIGGLPAVFFFDTRSELTYALLIFAGCLLNAAGFIGIFGFFARKTVNASRLK